MRVSEISAMAVQIRSINAKTKAKIQKASLPGAATGSNEPANVAISDTIRAQYTAADTAVSNIDNAISMVQTADSWTSKVNSALNRMNELAIQAHSGTVSDADMENINAEFTELQDEIVKIASGDSPLASFNGQPLLQGGSVGVQAGPDAGQIAGVSLADLSIGNSEVIGEVITYDGTGDPQKKKVTWNEVIDSINGLQAGDDKSVGIINQAIEFVAGKSASNASELSGLESMREGLLAYSSTMRSAESSLSGLDDVLSAAGGLSELMNSLTD